MYRMDSQAEPAEAPAPAAPAAVKKEKKKRNITEEHKQLLRERLAAARPLLKAKRDKAREEREKLKALESIGEEGENTVIKQKVTEAKPVAVKESTAKPKKPKYMKITFYEKPNEDVPFKLKFGKKQRPTLHYVSPEVSEESESESDDEPVMPTRSVSSVPDYSRYFD